MVSDELKRAIETAQKRHPEEASTMLVAVIDALLPRIVALERCRDLLDRTHRTINGYEQVPPCSDPDNCEIAIALEATS